MGMEFVLLAEGLTGWLREYGGGFNVVFFFSEMLRCAECGVRWMGKLFGGLGVYVCVE